MLEQLVVPVSTTDIEGKTGWHEGQVSLIPGPLLGGWTGHSERCTLPSVFAAMGVPKSERDPLGRWSPSGSDDYVRTYRALVTSLAYKFRAMLAGGNVVSATDEEEAIDEVRLYAARLGNIEPEVLQEASDRLWKTARGLYGLWSMDPAVNPVVLPADQVVTHFGEERAEVSTAKYLIVLSKKGSMLRLHRSDGCWKAQTLSFASFELCDLDPVPQNLYSHYCHTCWPRAPPQEEAMSGSDSSNSSADSAEDASESSEE